MTLSVQFLSLLAMIGTGITAGAFMDMIHTMVMNVGKKSFIRKHAILIEIIGWTIVGCATFYILFLVRDGAWRMYDPFAQISGILLYMSYFYKPFRLFGRIIFVLVVKPILFFVNVITSVIRLVFHLIKRILTLLVHPFVKLFKKLTKNTFRKKKK